MTTVSYDRLGCSRTSNLDDSGAQQTGGGRCSRSLVVISSSLAGVSLGPVALRWPCDVWSPPMSRWWSWWRRLTAHLRQAALIAQLQARLGRDSTNSSQPPSADSIAAKAKRQRDRCACDDMFGRDRADTPSRSSSPDDPGTSRRPRRAPRGHRGGARLAKSRSKKSR